MTKTHAEFLLDLHRELCAAIRSADEAFAHFYVAIPNAQTAARFEDGYRAALARARAALGALESECCGGPAAPGVASPDAFAATFEGARRAG